MDLTTHCPQCSTAFLVSEDQLELAQGWVRCGVCQEVFMAQAHTVAPSTPMVVSDAPLPYRRETVADEEPAVPSDALPSSATPEPMPEPVARTQSVPATASTTATARYRRASLGARFFLLIVLAAQLGADAYRNIPDTQPKLAFWLQTVCAPSVCTLRQSSALGIDDSSLTAAGSNAFHLKAMISNRAGLTLQAPSLALTFTGASDEVLARKVYAPKDWASQTEFLPGSSTTPIDLWVRWDEAASTARVAGYRLQAFYP